MGRLSGLNEQAIRISTLEKVGDNMAIEVVDKKEPTLEERIKELEQDLNMEQKRIKILSQSSTRIYSKEISQSEELAPLYEELIKDKRELLAMKSQCCGKCGGGFFEDGSVDGLCGGDECLPIKSTDIRHCFVPPKQIKKEEPNEPLF